MRLMISFAAVFLSDAISGEQLGFSNTEIGFLGSAHFFGFFIGCWWAASDGQGRPPQAPSGFWRTCW